MENILFCTYFDKYYLPKGLSMYFSLRNIHKAATLWILCMDDYTFQFLEKAQLPGVKLISLKEFEDENLKEVKSARSPIEYYWTCTPSLPLYVIKKNPKTSYIVYIDADMFIFSRFDQVFEEMGKSSIYFAEHRYPAKEKNREETSGRFNVGALIFKNDSEGVECLSRWRKQCIDWCFFREEDGKMGDQAYLNEWPKLYKKAAISQNLGYNAAPWNISQYKLTAKDKKIYVNSDRLVCYHFHGFKVLSKNKFSLCSQYLIPKFEYHLPVNAKQLIYTPYLHSIKESISYIEKLDPKFNYYESRKFVSIPNLKYLFKKYEI